MGTENTVKVTLEPWALEQTAFHHLGIVGRGGVGGGQAGSRAKALKQ